MKFRTPFHNDRVPLSVKVAVLLAGTVIVSLSLAGTVIYKAMRANTFHQHADSLAQVATGSAMGPFFHFIN